MIRNIDVKKKWSFQRKLLLVYSVLIIMICIGCSNIKNEKRTEREMLESLEALEEPLQVFYDGTGYFLLKSFVDSHPEINIRLVNCLPDTDNGFDEFDLNKTIEEYGEPDLIIARDELSVYLSEMFHEGHIADLTDFCSNDSSIDTDVYFPGTFDVFSTEEELYALPLGITMDFMLIAESKYNNSTFTKLEEGYTGRELLNVLVEEVHREKETGEFFNENRLPTLLFMHYLDVVTQTDDGIQLDEDLFKQVYDFNYHMGKEADEAIEFWNEQGYLYERNSGYAQFSAIEPRRYEGKFMGSIWNTGDVPALVLSYSETAYQHYTEEGINAVYFPTADDGNKYQARVKVWGAVSEKSNRKQLAYDLLRMLMDEEIDSFGAVRGTVPQGASLLNVNVYPIRIDNAISLLDKFEDYSAQLIYGNDENPIAILDRKDISDEEKEKHTNVLKSISGLFCWNKELMTINSIFYDYFDAEVVDYKNCYLEMLNCLNGNMTDFQKPNNSETSSNAEGSEQDKEEIDEAIVEELKGNIRDVEKGDTIFFGKVEQDGCLENGAEEIEWIVLEKTNEEIFVMSKNVLEWLTFSKYSAEIEVDGEMVLIPYDRFTWSLDYNQQRSWLTNEVYLNGFTDHEKMLILLKYHETPATDNNEWYEKGTYDYLYIPSKEEVEIYMPEIQLRQANMTPYVAGKNEKDVGEYSSWSLRTEGPTSKYSTQVLESGEFGATYTFTPNGVRPVMWLDIS